MDRTILGLIFLALVAVYCLCLISIGRRDTRRLEIEEREEQRRCWEEYVEARRREQWQGGDPYAPALPPEDKTV